jgi:hypothetical protein
MEGFVFTAAVLNLAYAVVALALVWAFLRVLDKRAGLDFKEFFKDLRNDPQAAATYLGWRFVGACVLVGLALR